MMNDFEIFMKDTFVLVKPNGDKKSFKGAVSAPGKIRTFDVSTPIEAGDIIERVLPNGGKETYRVHDATYGSGQPPEIPENYSVEVRKTTAIREDTKPNVTHNYSGVQSVQHGDHNIAHNTQHSGLNVNEVAQLIKALRASTATLPEAEQEEAKDALDLIAEEVASPKPRKKMLDILWSQLPTALTLATQGVALAQAIEKLVNG